MNKPYIVGIAGGSGSGKTFFLNRFMDHFSADEVCLLSQDDYYIEVAHDMTPEENKLYNFDLPRTIDNEQFEKDINCLLNNQTIYKKEYTFNNPNIVPKMMEIKPAPIIIVEGHFILYFKGIADLFDMTIFVDADEEVALQRRLKRDLLERGYSHDDVMYKWVNHVVPAYKEFLLPYKSDCHKLVINNTRTAEGIRAVTDEISNDLRKKVFG